MADAATPTREQITGLVLAGGQGTRLGGIDKGLQDWKGEPLARRAAERLAPQVSQVMLSANRHLGTYRAWGLPVWPDPPELAGYQGPLAGVLAGLRRCATPWMVVVPCDCPHFPLDLVTRLAQAVRADTEIAMAGTATGLEPAFCLMRREVEASLARQLQAGQRKVERWASTMRCVGVAFDDAAAFFNINTPGDLARG